MAEKDLPNQSVNTPDRKKGIAKFILIPIILILMVGLGAVVANMGVLPIPGLTSTGGGSGDTPPKADPEPSVSYIYPMKPFIVNLMDESGGRYLKVKFEMELSHRALEAEIEKRMPQLTDSVIMLLSSKNYEDIASYEGKERMRHEMIIRLNSFLETGTIQRIYFTEFVIQ